MKVGRKLGEQKPYLCRLEKGERVCIVMVDL